MFYPVDFMLSLKVKLIQKVGNINFVHPWKDIVINQLSWPEHPGICFENLLTFKHFTFTYNLLDAYREWKDRTSIATKKCINHCIWGNNLITDIGSKLWLSNLIECNVNYLTDFVDSNGSVLSYEEFCKKNS